MASMMVVVLVLCLFIPAVIPSGDLWRLECDPAVGIAAQTTVIRCHIRDNNDNFTIQAVAVKKVTDDKHIFQHYITKQQTSGDVRFGLENPAVGPSLQISNTMFSDAGVYEYTVLTNSGQKTAKFNISVTAKYKDPIISTWPENVTDGGPVDLYCNATEGYPAGTIHWFDRSETNWTINSILKNVDRDNGGSKSVALFSKLSFKSIDSGLAPFKCIVLNYKYIQEGEKTFQITPAKHGSPIEEVTSKTTQIVAGVMVIGSLIVGLLLALLVFRRRQTESYVQADQADVEIKQDLNKA